MLSRFFARAVYTFLHASYHIFIYLLIQRLLLACLLLPLLQLLGLYRDPLEVRFHHAHDVVIIVKDGAAAAQVFDLASGAVVAGKAVEEQQKRGKKRASSPNADEMSQEKIQRFEYTAPIYGPHFSTIFSVLARGELVVGQPQYAREVVEASGGQHVALDWVFHSKKTNTPPKAIVFIIPGLNSCSQNGYIRSFVNALPDSSVDICVFNTRGYGGEHGPTLTAAAPFHAGFVSDIRALLYRYFTPSALRIRYKTDAPPPLVGCGFSMGSNLLAKFLSEEGDRVRWTGLPDGGTGQKQKQQPQQKQEENNTNNDNGQPPGSPSGLAVKRIKSSAVASPRRSSFTSAAAAAAGSASSAGREHFPQIMAGFGIGCPWSLISALHNLATLPHALYESQFLGGLQAMIAKNFSSEVNDVSVDGVLSEKNVIDYDQHHVIPLHGFLSREHYYSSAQAWDRLEGCRVPLFAVSSTHDAICGYAKIDEEWVQLCAANPNIAYMRLPSGGHLANLSGPLDEFTGRATNTPLEDFIITKTMVPMLERLL